MKITFGFHRNRSRTASTVRISGLLILMLATFAPVTARSAEQTLAEYDWTKLPSGAHLLGGEPRTVEARTGRTMLKIVNTNTTPLHVRIMDIQPPPITQMAYGLAGKVKCEGVQGDAYLEMWNCFAPAKPGSEESRYFSRTLGPPSHPMGKLTGSMDWRPFSLPFDRNGASGAPARLELNLFLPGQGTVYLGVVKLVETDRGVAALLVPANAWWGDRSAGLIGGIGGACIGCFAGLLGWLAAQGKARSFVLISMKVLAFLGAVCCVAAVIAIAGKQPYAVWFPLTLGGLILLSIIPFRLRQFQRQYHELELRRMNSIDALQG
jgi:hypothetical protein